MSRPLAWRLTPLFTAEGEQLDLVGKTLGSYRVLSLIGEGGMGEVYLAEHTGIGRKAALKVLHTERAKQKGMVDRFFNEARAANRVRHPNIVDVYDFGKQEGIGAYLVMELLEGETLSERIHSQGTLELSEASRIIQRVASALTAAHEAGIVHRDLKPENIFLVPDPNHPGENLVKILDFGIAKLKEGHGGDADGPTRTGQVMGTPLYMSPEQCDGAKHVDHRSDVYSLGIIAYEMVTGRPPFVAAGRGQVIAMHIAQEPPPPRQLEPELPASLEEAILSALEKDPEERPQSTVTFASLFAEAIGEKPLAAPPRRAGGTTMPGGVARDSGGSSGSDGRPRGRTPGQDRDDETAAAPLSTDGAIDVEATTHASDADSGDDSDADGAHKPARTTLSGGASEIDLATDTSARRPKSVGALIGVAAALLLSGVILWQAFGGEDSPGTGSAVAAFPPPPVSAGTSATAAPATTAMPATARATAATTGTAASTAAPPKRVLAAAEVERIFVGADKAMQKCGASKPTSVSIALEVGPDGVPRSVKPEPPHATDAVGTCARLVAGALRFPLHDGPSVAASHTWKLKRRAGADKVGTAKPKAVKPGMTKPATAKVATAAPYVSPIRD